jgi:hypothetical protein
MTKKNRNQVIWTIIVCLFFLTALLYLIQGNIPLAMTNIAVGMMFVLFGILNVRKAGKAETPDSDGASKL